MNYSSVLLKLRPIKTTNHEIGGSSQAINGNYSKTYRKKRVPEKTFKENYSKKVHLILREAKDLKSLSKSGVHYLMKNILKYTYKRTYQLLKLKASSRK